MINSEHKSAQNGFTVHRVIGLAVDPIHVGTGGMRLGRVDNTIVRDPVTRLPKIPGSSLAGVHRAYAAMALEEERLALPEKQRRERPYYPDDAGASHKGTDGAIHAVFGHASFAGLAAFSDAYVALFPVSTRYGPRWVTSPGGLHHLDVNQVIEDEGKAYVRGGSGTLNLGWLHLQVAAKDVLTDGLLKGFGIHGGAPCSAEEIVLVSDKLFCHVVNSNLEVRTSVAIDPATGAADEGKLFTYEAIPRGAILVWEVTCRAPRHFGREVKDAADRPCSVDAIVRKAHPYLKALGIGGMGTRGMGRLRILGSQEVGR